jgi:tripartite-type tricarboxylate transporter receptor subunit TctC
MTNATVSDTEVSFATSLYIDRQSAPEVNVSIADPNFQARLVDLGGTALVGSPADFAKLISDEVKKWSRVVLAANMKRG